MHQEETTSQDRLWKAFLADYVEGNIDARSQPDIDNLDHYLGQSQSWLTAPPAKAEHDRLRAVSKYHSGMSRARKQACGDLNFDMYTRMAATLCGTPMSCLGFIDIDSHHILSEQGLPTWRDAKLPRSEAMCSHTILKSDRECFVVNDASHDWRFAKMPMVKDEPFVRYYMGCPVTTVDGINTGALCVFDTKSRPIPPTDGQKQGLSDLADAIMRELDSQAERIATVEAKRVFLSSISHELKSPLHGLLASSELLAESGEMSPFQATCLRTISNCGRAIGDVIEHVLSVSKNNANDLTASNVEVDLPTFLEETLDSTWAGRVTKATTTTDNLEVLIDIDLTHIRHSFTINRGEIGRIIMNVFGNALKYTESGSITTKLFADKGPFRVSGKKYQKVSLVFQDTGKGIAEDFMPNLFAPFVQQDNFCEGFGLGLSMVKQLIERNQGTIQIESVLHAGTTVTITLVLEVHFASGWSSGQSPKVPFQNLRDVRFAVYVGGDESSEALRLRHSSILQICQDSFAMVIADSLQESDVVILLDPTHISRIQKSGIDSPVVVYATPGSKASEAPSTFLQVPVGPFKLGRALSTAISNHARCVYQGQRRSVVHLDPVSPPTSSQPKDRDPMEDHMFRLGYQARMDETTSENSHDGDRRTSAAEATADTASRRKDERRTSSIDQAMNDRPERPFCLCVDDCAVSSQILATFLKKRGLRYKCARDGQAAVDFAGSHHFDLIFMGKYTRHPCSI